MSRSTRSRKKDWAAEQYDRDMCLATVALPFMMSKGPSRDPRLVKNTEKLLQGYNTGADYIRIRDLARMLSEGSIRVCPYPFELKDGTCADRELLSADFIREVAKHPSRRYSYVYFIPESEVKKGPPSDGIRLRK